MHLTDVHPILRLTLIEIPQGTATVAESSSRSTGNVTNSFTKIVVCGDSHGLSLHSCYCGFKLSTESVTELVEFTNTTWSNQNSPSGCVLLVLPVKIKVFSVIRQGSFIKQTTSSYQRKKSQIARWEICISHESCLNKQLHSQTIK